MNQKNKTDAIGEEELIPVEGYEGHYFVSRSGNVYSIKTGRIKPLKPLDNGNGYKCVSLCLMGADTKHYIHRMVCRAFHGAPPSTEHQANHKDGDRANNAASNLHWCTNSENNKHSFKVLGRTVKSTVVEAVDPKTGEVVKEYKSIAAVEKDGYLKKAVAGILNGSRASKIHDGLIWRKKYSCDGKTDANLSSKAQLAGRIKAYLGQHGEENGACLLLYEAMLALAPKKSK